MSFLQPWLLAALPIAALPIIIHLINQRRFHTIDWAAMRFLLEANRMLRGYARIRQWLILLCRVLAIAGLIFMISRPLASGWLGLSGGGRADTTLVLVDRSPSMRQVGQGTVASKIETGVAQLVQTLNTLGSTRWVLIDSHTAEPREIESPDAILSSPSAQAASTATSLPAMLEAAHDYIKNNRTGETEVWICSDLRANDWNAQSGRWQSLRESFQEFKQSVRFHLLAYPSPAPEDVAIRVTNVERQTSGDGAALLISLKLTREGNTGTDESSAGVRGAAKGKTRLPVRFEIEGASSELAVEFEGREYELKSHRIPLAGDRPKGWGRVSIPSDLNPANNEYYFVFDDPPPRRTILVAEGAEEVRPLELAAGIAADPTVKCEVEAVAAQQLSTVRWEDVALLLWQAPLPTGDAAVMVKQFVDRGGRTVFFPPKLPSKDAFFDVHWTSWVEPPEPLRTETWWGDADLLARTQSGAAVPVGEMIIRRYCGLDGEFTPLATLPENKPLLARVTTDRGGVYFCATTSSFDDASLGTDGVALYVMIQRALAAGAAELGNSLQLNAGDRFPATADAWTKLGGAEDVLSTEFPYHAGVYAAGERTLAVNRAAPEDHAAILSDTQVAGLFRGLDFDRVDDRAGNVTSLTREVWRLFLGAMLVALVAEAGLCIPRARRANDRSCHVNTTRALTFLASPWSIAAGIVAWLAVAVISFISWRRSGYRGDIGCLEVLRLLIVAVATILLNQPEWIEEYRPDEKPAIAVLWDASNSMTTKDVVDAKQPTSEARTRESAIEPLTKEDAWSPLRGRFNVVMQPFAKPAPGKRTDLHAALASTLDKTAGLTAVVLASDGDWNEGEPPVEAAVRLRMANVPVFGIPVGSRQRLPDVELLSLDAPTFGIVGKNVRVPFTIDSSLPREYTATVVLKASDGEEVTKDIRIAPQGRTSDSLLWKPKQTGDFSVTLEIPKHDSEAVSDNNRLDAPVSIREEKLRVLVVESYPRWEYRYLRNALSRDPGVELSCLLFHPGLEKVGGGNKDYIKAFPEKLEELAPYDVVFLGDVGIEEGQLTEEQCRLLRGLVEFQASGLVFMPGWQGRQFSLLETPLEDVYPVLLDEGQLGGWGSRTPCRFELTASGERSLLTKLADSQENNADVWDNLPGFQWYAPVLRAKAGTEVLCVHGDAVGDYGRLPLIVTRTYGAGKVLFMGTDGAWRWRKGVEDKYHYRFWGQVVRWMAYQRNMAKGETMRLYYTPDQPQLRKTVTLKANVMEPTGEPLSKGEVVARVVAPSGNGQTIRFTPLGDEWGAFMGRYVSEEPGKHTVTLSCRETGASLEASFYVQGADKEPVGRPARPEVIEEISRVTRGKIVPADNLTEIVNYFQNMPDPPPSVRRLQIWCHPATASLIVVLLGAFWVARKAVGLI